MLISKEDAILKQKAVQPVFFAKYMTDKNFAGVTHKSFYEVHFFDIEQDTIHIKNDDGEFDALDVENFDLYSEMPLSNILKDKWRDSGLGEMDDTLLDIIAKIGKDGVEFLLSEWDLVEQIIEQQVEPTKTEK